MADLSFKKFQEKHPEYQDTWSKEYLCTCYVESATLTMIEQHGFFLDEDKPSRIAELFKLGEPQIIYCGQPDLVELFNKWFPAHKDKVQLHGWYEHSIYAVVHTDRITLKSKESK